MLLRSIYHNNQLLRTFDVLLCLLALPFLIPLFLVLAMAIKLTSPGPIIYRATRVGRYGEPFVLYKFRSMHEGADRAGPAITGRSDQRITRVGRFIRRYKLDELPQIINVLKGDMSLVGPRPEDPRYVSFYSDEQRLLLSVRPGLTSPASLRYRREEMVIGGANWESTYVKRVLPHKLAIDSTYINNYTLHNYLAVLFATMVTVWGMRGLVESILKMRNRHIMALDVLLLILTPTVALALAVNRSLMPVYPNRALVFFTFVALAIKLLVFHQSGLYARYWRYTSFSALGRIVVAVGCSTLLLLGLVAVHPQSFIQLDLPVYGSLAVIDGLLTVMVVVGIRFSLRVINEWHSKYSALCGSRRILIIGAGSAGKMVLNEIKTNPDLDMSAVAFIDDDPEKIGTPVQGLPVVGSTENIAKCVTDYSIERVIIAMPSAQIARQQQIADQCSVIGVETYCLPGVYELIAGYKTISPTPKVDLNQLLKRPPVATDKTELAELLADATVLVTGAGGSIGRELCRQIAQLKPGRLILLGHGENSIFEIGMELRLAFPSLPIHQVIADVRDAKRINQVVSRFRPKVIYHAAAHKHVPLMQSNIEEVITNNVQGTLNVLRAAEHYSVENFVLISTDKAINPTSMMGASKRIAELLVEAAAKRSGRAYKAVRFGNVLGSRGSVIPIFQRQIAAGGPVTITHPDMRRYFMTIPEAVQLVLLATVLGHSGEIFVLDMGKPVRIVDLAEGLIQMAGREPGDIEIVFSGIRPGEKLFEELFQATEHYERTKYEKIFVATEQGIVADRPIEDIVAHLVEAAQQLDADDVVRQVKQIIPTYQSEPAFHEVATGHKPEAVTGYSSQQELALVPAG